MAGDGEEKVGKKLKKKTSAAGEGDEVKQTKKRKVAAADAEEEDDGKRSKPKDFEAFSGSKQSTQVNFRLKSIKCARVSFHVGAHIGM